jgi:Protein of unknown function C-terminus (DUF2399)
MAVHPAPDTPGADAAQEPQPRAIVGAQPYAADRPGGRQRVFGYLDTASAGRCRQLMGVLLADKRRFRLRMTPSQIADRLWERFAARYWPNTAVAAVLETAVAAGMRILVHADGDPAGAAIAELVLRRKRARPWRELDADSGVHEEALLDELLSDLRAAA